MKLYLLIGIVLLAIIPVVAALPPPPPAAPSSDFFSVYGDVLVNGAQASDGTNILFKVEGALVGKTIANDGDYAYVISEGFGVSDGDEVKIYIAGKLAGSAIFESNAVKNVDLSVVTSENGDNNDSDDSNGDNAGGSGGGGGGSSNQPESEDVEEEKTKWTADDGFSEADYFDGSQITGASIITDFLAKPSTIVGLLGVLLAVSGIAFYVQARRTLKVKEETKSKPSEKK